MQVRPLFEGDLQAAGCRRREKENKLDILLYFDLTQNSRDGILGHKFDKRLENQTVELVLKIRTYPGTVQKNPRNKAKQENSSLFRE